MLEAIVNEVNDDLFEILHNARPNKTKKSKPQQVMLTYKTIEIIIENKPWQANAKKIPQNKNMDIRIGYNEIELRSRIKACGGK